MVAVKPPAPVKSLPEGICSLVSAPWSFVTKRMKQICGANISLKREGATMRFFSADGDLRFNFLDYEAQTSGLDFMENLVSLLVDIASIKKRAQTSSN